MALPRIVPFIAAIALTGLALPTAALAASYRSGDTSIAKGQTINDDLYVAGNNLTIDGTVNGDIIAAGGTVTINGDVHGDLMAIGEKVIIHGTVSESVRTAGGELQVYGTIGKDLLAASGTLTLEPGSRVLGDTKLAGSDITLAGTTATVDIAGDRVTVAPSGIINGDINYIGERTITQQSGAKVSGSLHQRKPSDSSPSPLSLVVSALLALLGSLLFSGLFYLIAPVYLRAALIEPAGRGGIITFQGFLALFFLPIICLILIISGIGTLPGIVLLLALPFMYYLSYLTAVLAVGRALTLRLAGSENTPAAPWNWALLGSISLTVISFVPILGQLVIALAFLYGAGLLVRGISRHRAILR